MSDEETTGTTTTGTTESGETHEDGGAGGDGLTLRHLDEKIDRVVDMVKGLGRKQSTATKADHAADVAGQVRTEVDKIKQAEGRQKDREDRLTALETTVKQIVEVAPREYRRITHILWGDGDE